MLDENITSDLNAMSKAELKALKRLVDKALANIDKRARQAAISAATRSVVEFGFSLEEVLGFLSEGMGGRAPGGRPGRPVRFRNPENPRETWSGRGMQPAWLKRQLEAGKSKDDLRA